MLPTIDINKKALHIISIKWLIWETVWPEIFNNLLLIFPFIRHHSLIFIYVFVIFFWIQFSSFLNTNVLQLQYPVIFYRKCICPLTKVSSRIIYPNIFSIGTSSGNKSKRICRHLCLDIIFYSQTFKRLFENLLQTERTQNALNEREAIIKR